MQQNNTSPVRRLNLVRMGRRKKQSGELSLIEAGAYMAGAALLAIAVIKGSTYVYTLIKAQQGLQATTSSRPKKGFAQPAILCG
jgi:hypothetical protein